MDRPAMLRTIVERIDYMSKEQILFVNEAKRVLGQNMSFNGKIFNALFRITHYKTIYSVE